MRASASAALLSAALCALVLSGCRPDVGSSQEGGSQVGNARTDGTGDLIGQVLFMATGAFDVQSTQKARVPGGLRRAVWEDRVPLDARSLEYELYVDEGEVGAAQVTDYDSTSTEQMTVEQTCDLLRTLPEFEAMLEGAPA